MPSLVDIADMQSALVTRAYPTITIWNRLEGRPRSIDFGRALRAEIRDALWLLTRQWQIGEFRGDDAGSPVTARFQITSAPLTGYRPKEGTATGLDGSIPLETLVERRSIERAMEAGGLGLLDLRLVLGRRFLKSVPPVYQSSLTEKYAFVLPDPQSEGDTERVAHPEVWSTLQALAGRALDGYRLYRYLEDDAAHRPWDGIPVLEADKATLTAAAHALRDWFETAFAHPTETAWDPTRLEHRFSVTAPVEDGTKRLLAEEHPGGHLDWTAFSVDPSGARGSGAPGKARSVIPTAARFNGMPDQRWWAFEDGTTNLGEVRADTTDLARLLFVEFALVAGNDWYTIPLPARAGTTDRVEALVVTNVFGERLWIEPAGRGTDDDWQRWSMFTLDVAGTGKELADMSLLIPPTLAQVENGKPLEDVLFVRDEIANFVWGIERTVPLATGAGRRGAEAADETRAHRERLISANPAPPPTPAAPISYRVMQGVPEHWIPFIATHVPGEVRETQLQRAAMTRIIEGDRNPPKKIRPRTTLLREGLDTTPAQAYFVHESEVPRAGTQVSVAFKRTRGIGGRVWVWLAALRQTGRGEASSTLAFDKIVPTP
ncbi:hypothetical protein [Microvirga massiliensis]|uniref:hypothetical protein n=1 Tax=Microvirga massiliensis TaxID=1033741 RepID=UPI00062B66D9|nr:hypothetical protein [Microvirga massiliensis]